MIDTAFGVILNQGLLGAVAVIAMFVAAWAVKGWLDEKEKRVADLKEYGKLYAETSKDLLNGISNAQKSIDALVTIHNNDRT